MKSALIAEAHVGVRELPVRVAFSISRESLSTAKLAFVTLRDEGGCTGLGECAPFPSLTHDDIERATIVARDLVSRCAGLAPLAALAMLRELREDATKLSITAFVGVETALYDLHARQLGVPLSALFGTAGRSSVQTDITLPIMPAAAVEGFWAMYRDYGFTFVKIKVAGRVDEDLALVRALVACAPHVTVTLDGNQGYALSDAIRLVAELARAGIRPAFFEQPLAEDDWHGPRALEEASGVRVCLDETVRTARDMIRVVRERTASLVNLKIMKSGLEETLRIAHVARGAGIELMIGGMLESEVAMGASLQLAAGFGDVRYADLDTPFFLSTHPTTESPWHGRSATLVPTKTPGLGLTLT